ncbi:hypothetical protein BJ944DRAFT_234915 [Cunninghamella echinulata]|nr:hypothetical protein BJ944DRAFT_234915 [Cunninghamella echinulata]
MKFSLASTVAIAFFAHQALAGPIEGCLQTHTVVAGDSCVSIAAAFKLTPDQFYAMNPKLHHLGDHICDNLDDGKPYCVCTKKPCVAESSAPSGNTTVGGTTTGAATTGAATTTGAVTTGAASTPVAPKSGTSTSGSASGTAPSPSTSPSAGNSLIVPTTMLGLVSVAVAVLL